MPDLPKLWAKGGFAKVYSVLSIGNFKFYFFCLNLTSVSLNETGVIG